MLISKDKRQMAVSLINEAVDAGARCFKACAVLRISMRTFKRWRYSTSGPGVSSACTRAVASSSVIGESD